MFVYICHAADWSTCRVRIPARRVASEMGTSKTAIYRGVHQLVSAGVIASDGTAERGSTTWYVVQPSPAAAAEPSTEPESGAKASAASAGRPKNPMYAR